MGPALAKATDWAAVTAWAACATVAVYVVLGIFAWIQVLQARRLREEQARPFVIVDFEPGFLIYLTVENIGRTMAREIVCTQVTKLRLGAVVGGGDHVADLDLAVGDHDPVDQQLDQLAALLEAGLVQTSA
jgi:hypothetical protein